MIQYKKIANLAASAMISFRAPIDIFHICRIVSDAAVKKTHAGLSLMEFFGHDNYRSYSESDIQQLLKIEKEIINYIYTSNDSNNIRFGFIYAIVSVGISSSWNTSDKDIYGNNKSTLFDNIQKFIITESNPGSTSSVESGFKEFLQSDQGTVL